MALIAVRNVSFLWIWVGALHHLLYVWHVVPDKLKFNPSYPKKQQHYRDFLMSTSGALIDSAMQIGFMHLYATNKVPWYSDFWAGPQWAQQLGSWQGPAFSMVMILVGCLYQDFHFYWVHRYIHRWGWVRRKIRRPAWRKRIAFAQLSCVLRYPRARGLYSLRSLSRTLTRAVSSTSGCTPTITSHTTRGLGRASRCTRWSTCSTSRGRLYASSSDFTRCT